MPIDYSKYPANWKTEIRPAILKRAGNRCEKCGVDNNANGARTMAGDFVHLNVIKLMTPIELEINFDKVKIIKIVLTIAHLDHDINNNTYTDNFEDDENNLGALCQKCHLDHDRDQHAETRRRNKDARTGQLNLLED